jgi:hypothetical protein
VLLAFLPRLKDYRDTLDSNDTSVSDDKKHLSFLIDFLESEHAETLRKIATLLAHREITFDLLWAIFLPKSIVITSCDTTSEPRAFQLQEMNQYSDSSNEHPYWRLDCEFLQANRKFPSTGQEFKLAETSFRISKFEGTKKISELHAYPIEWHANPDDLKAKLTRRGHKWMGLNRIHHMQYKGLAYNGRYSPSGYGSGRTHYVKGRIMIDRRKSVLVRAFCSSIDISTGSFSDAEPYDPRKLQSIDSAEASKESYSDDQAMLTPPILYGFSLMDKLWCEYAVVFVSFIELISVHSGVQRGTCGTD